jgi:O-antigen/teichoic acid export membrane protein
MTQGELAPSSSSEAGVSEESLASNKAAVRPPARPFGINATTVFVVTVFIQLVGYASTYYLSHGIGSHDAGKGLWGLIQLYLIVASSLNMLGELRLSSAYTYFISRDRSATELARTFLWVRTGMVLLAGALLLALAGPLNLVRGTVTFEIFGVFMLLPVLWSLSTVYTQTAIGQGDSLAGQIPLFLESVVRTVALVAVALPPFLHGGALGDPGTLLWEMTIAYVLGAAASAAYSLPFVIRYQGKFRPLEARRMFVYAWPLMISLVLLYLSNSVSPLIVNGAFGTVALNIFNAANGFRILVLAIPAAVATPLFPHLSGLHSQREYELVRDRTWRGLRFTAMLVVPSALVLVVYRVPLLNLLYPGSYTVGQVALAILAISAIPLALSQIIGTALNAIGYQRLEMYLTSVQVVALFGSVAVLFPPPLFLGTLGLPGLTAISVALLISGVAALAVNAFFMLRVMLVHVQPRPIASILLSGVASFGALYLANHYIFPNVNWRWYTLLGVALLGFAVYTLVLILVGELTREDVFQLGALLGLPPGVVEPFASLCWREAWPPIEGLPPGGAGAFRPAPFDPLTLEPHPPDPPTP